MSQLMPRYLNDKYGSCPDGGKYGFHATSNPWDVEGQNVAVICPNEPVSEKQAEMQRMQTRAFAS